MSDPIANGNGKPRISSDDSSAAIRSAVRDAVLTHAKLGRSVPVSRDGKIIWLSPEEILANPPAGES